METLIRFWIFIQMCKKHVAECLKTLVDFTREYNGLSRFEIFSEPVHWFTNQDNIKDHHSWDKSYGCCWFFCLGAFTSHPCYNRSYLIGAWGIQSDFLLWPKHQKTAYATNAPHSKVGQRCILYHHWKDSRSNAKFHHALLQYGRVEFGRCDKAAQCAICICNND